MYHFENDYRNHDLAYDRERNSRIRSPSQLNSSSLRNSHGCLALEGSAYANSEVEKGRTRRLVHQRRLHASGQNYQSYHEAEWLEKSITPEHQNNMYTLSESSINNDTFHSLLDRERRLPLWLTPEKASHSPERQRKFSVYNAELPRRASFNSHQLSTQPLSEENRHSWVIPHPANGESPRERNQRLSNLELSTAFDEACKIDQEQDRNKCLSLSAKGQNEEMGAKIRQSHSLENRIEGSGIQDIAEKRAGRNSRKRKSHLMKNSFTTYEDENNTMLRPWNDEKVCEDTQSVQKQHVSDHNQGPSNKVRTSKGKLWGKEMDEAGMHNDPKKKVGRHEVQQMTCQARMGRSWDQEQQKDMNVTSCKWPAEDSPCHSKQSCTHMEFSFVNGDRDRWTNRQSRGCASFSSETLDFPHDIAVVPVMFEQRKGTYGSKPLHRTNGMASLSGPDVLCKKASRHAHQWGSVWIQEDNNIRDAKTPTREGETESPRTQGSIRTKNSRHDHFRKPHSMAWNCLSCEYPKNDSYISSEGSCIESKCNPLMQQCSRLKQCAPCCSIVSDASLDLFASKSKQGKHLPWEDGIEAFGRHVIPGKQVSRSNPQWNSQGNNSVSCADLENASLTAKEEGNGEPPCHAKYQESVRRGIHTTLTPISINIESIEQSAAKPQAGEIIPEGHCNDKGEKDALKTVKQENPRHRSKGSNNAMHWWDSLQNKVDVLEKEEGSEPEDDVAKNYPELQRFLQGANISNRRDSVCPEIEKTMNLVKMNGSKMSLLDLRKDMCLLVNKRVFDSIYEEK